MNNIKFFISLIEYLQKEKAKQYGMVNDYREVKVNEYSGYDVDQLNIGGIGYIYENTGRIYVLVLDGEDTIFNQILSTFKFMK